MDTDNLSKETYAATIITAEKFNHDLTLQFGLLSYRCDTDDDFLDKSETMIKRWLDYPNLEKLMMNIFFGNPPNETAFKKTINKILTNIDEVRKIPMEQRHFETW